ncbi:MAG: hypothetical protein LBB24_02875, partial [Rickettsiales bacterium]|nr:hypothetical protein [Rickettsiales bacterium]
MEDNGETTENDLTFLIVKAMTESALFRGTKISVKFDGPVVDCIIANDVPTKMLEDGPYSRVFGVFSEYMNRFYSVRVPNRKLLPNTYYPQMTFYDSEDMAKEMNGEKIYFDFLQRQKNRNAGVVRLGGLLDVFHVCSLYKKNSDGKFYVQNIVISECCERGPLSMIDRSDIVKIFGDRNTLIDLLTTLAFLADEGLVNFNIRPDNIFVTADGKLKIGDFSLARRFEKNFLNTPLPRAAGRKLKMTSLSAIGKPGKDFLDVPLPAVDMIYAAPEVKSDEGNMFFDKIDVFSLGVVLLKILCLPKGEVLFSVFDISLFSLSGDPGAYMEKVLSVLSKETPDNLLKDKIKEFRLEKFKEPGAKIPEADQYVDVLKQLIREMCEFDAGKRASPHGTLEITKKLVPLPEINTNDEIPLGTIGDLRTYEDRKLLEFIMRSGLFNISSIARVTR